jgi:hypothetical protein
MSRVVVVPDDEDVGAAALDVTNVVRQLWNTFQWCIDQGYGVDEDDDPAFEQFRAFAGLWTQEEYRADKERRFIAHTEWLRRMQLTNWGMTSEEGL